jgi:aerobic-type carbon monoxide dehydrogenase small subunit (CoxS/CutS family)
MARVTQLHINGTRRAVDTDAERSLLQVLREDLDLTGCKYGCGEGRCGACTVLVDGKPTRSCVTEVGSVEGKEVRTIEGLAPEGGLHPVQEAFLKADALQCGYCTTGMILSSVALLAEKPDPSPAEVVRFLNGNMCRCGTYPRIVNAVRAAAQAMKGGSR